MRNDTLSRMPLIKRYAPTPPCPEKLASDLVLVFRKIRKEGRRAKTQKRKDLIRNEYISDLLTLVSDHIGAAAVTGGIHPLLASGVRSWLVARNGSRMWAALEELEPHEIPTNSDILDCSHSECGA